MKVFLMHPDRDFDPDQKRPVNEAALIQDLELNTLFEAMAQGDKFLFEVAHEAVLGGLEAPEPIRYRQESLRDCLAYPDVVRQIYSIAEQAMDRKRRYWLGVFSHYPSGVLSGGRQMLEMFVDLLVSLKHIADEFGDGFQSPAFRRLFSMIREELSDDYFADVKRHLAELRFHGGVVLSAELGTANEGTNYILRKSRRDSNWLDRLIGRAPPTYSYSLHPRDDAGARALGDLRDRGVNLVANAVAQAADHVDSFFKVLLLELAFYIGCLNLAEQLARLQEPIVFPEPAPASERRHSFSSLYDVSLALTMQQKVVGNDVNADEKDLVIITGANQGGKTTFLRSVGIAQLMMQCGMFVPAQSFHAGICDGLWTHFKREEDASMESGKLDEELGRMSDIVDDIVPNAMVLLNESFAATNEREGSEIARQITRALLDKGIKAFYVTHLYDLANGFYENGKERSVFLRAERGPGGERTFKLSSGSPLQTSYGKDVYCEVFGQQPERVGEGGAAPQG